MNELALIICILLFAIWNLDFISSLLNLKALQPELPEKFNDVFDQKKYEKSQRYTAETEKFGIIESIMSLMLLLVFWFLGGFNHLDIWLRESIENPIFLGVAYIGILLFAQTIISIPTSIYKTFVIEQKFGFNKTKPATFIADQIKGLGIGAIIGLPIIALILWIFGSVPIAWLWAWISLTVIQLLLTYIAPSVFLPMFNKFEPMPEGELKEAIETMAKKCDFPLTELYVMDGSKRSTKSNAFFTGFGKRKKIALFDTLIENHTTEELVGVLAHEIGHFKCKHIVKGLVSGSLQTGIIFFLLGLATRKDYALSTWLSDAYFVSQPSIHTGLIFFFILFSPVSRITSVFGNMSSRKHEFEADAYASDVQETPEHLIAALKKLSADNLVNLTPHPLPVFLDYSHPPMLERLNALEQLGEKK